MDIDMDMDMDMDRPRNPFEIPELRSRLALYVTTKDALPCILVSKDWAHTFLAVIWHTIDLKRQSRILDLNQSTIYQHNHFIRVVRHADTSPGVAWLFNSRVNRLRELSIRLTHDPLHRAQGLDVICRNGTNIQTLELEDYVRRTSDQAIGPDGLLATTHCILPASVLVPHFYSASPVGTVPATTSRLCDLVLRGVCMLREGFSTVLEGSPLLERLSVSQSIFIGQPTSPFKHMRLSALICSVTLVLHPDFYNSSGNNQVSLLTHFPNLKKWVMKRLQHEPQRHMNRIRNEVNEHCRNLKRLHMDYSTGPNVVMVCRDIFSNLTSFQFTYTELSAELLTSILLHQDTLKSLSAHHSSFGSGFDRPSVSPIVDHFQASGRLLQLIPQSCARLTDLCFPGHEMDMCIVETVTWKCTELKDLRIRIKALNTRERIATAIGLLNSARSTRSQALLKPRTKTPRTPVAKEKKTRSTTKNGPGASGFMDDSIEARVARFLFKFEHLQRVWLGDHFWSV